MMAKIKMGLQLIRYAFGLKMNVIIIVTLAVCGLLLEFLSHGTLFLGAFFISSLSLCPVQFLYGICISNAAGASPWRKRMQTVMPALLAFLVNMIVFTVMIIFKMAEAWMFPEEAAAIWGSLISVAMLHVLLGVYNGVCYKYFAVSIIIMYVMIFGVSFFGGYVVRKGGLGVGFGALVYHSPVASIAVIYGSIIVAAILQYVISLALYKRPLSKWAQGAAMKRYL